MTSMIKSLFSTFLGGGGGVVDDVDDKNKEDANNFKLKSKKDLEHKPDVLTLSDIENQQLNNNVMTREGSSSSIPDTAILLKNLENVGDDVVVAAANKSTGKQESPTIVENNLSIITEKELEFFNHDNMKHYRQNVNRYFENIFKLPEFHFKELETCIMDMINVPTTLNNHFGPSYIPFLQSYKKKFVKSVDLFQTTISREENGSHQQQRKGHIVDINEDCQLTVENDKHIILTINSINARSDIVEVYLLSCVITNFYINSYQCFQIKLDIEDRSEFITPINKIQEVLLDKITPKQQQQVSTPIIIQQQQSHLPLFKINKVTLVPYSNIITKIGGGVINKKQKHNNNTNDDDNDNNNYIEYRTYTPFPLAIQDDHKKELYTIEKPLTQTILTAPDDSSSSLNHNISYYKIKPNNKLWAIFIVNYSFAHIQSLFSHLDDEYDLADRSIITIILISSIYDQLDLFDPLREDIKNFVVYENSQSYYKISKSIVRTILTFVKWNLNYTTDFSLRFKITPFDTRKKISECFTTPLHLFPETTTTKVPHQSSRTIELNMGILTTFRSFQKKH